MLKSSLSVFVNKALESGERCPSLNISQNLNQQPLKDIIYICKNLKHALAQKR